MEAPVPRSGSLEYLTTLSARGIAPANAIVEDLTASECRLRTVVLFDIGDAVEFTFGQEGVFVRGTVCSRALSGSRFVYIIRLDRMSAKEMDALARATPRPDSAAVPPMEHLTRSSPRVFAGFTMMYRTPTIAASPALAVDVSSDRLMMSCTKMLVPGIPIELCFTLPAILGPAPEQMTLGARIVSRQELKKGTYVYGLAFMRLDERHRTILAEYVTAVRESRKPASQ